MRDAYARPDRTRRQRFRWLAALLALSLVVNAVTGVLAGYVHAHAIHHAAHHHAVHGASAWRAHFGHHSDDYDHDHDRTHEPGDGAEAARHGGSDVSDASRAPADHAGVVVHGHAPALAFALVATPCWPPLRWRQRWDETVPTALRDNPVRLLERPPRTA